MYKHILVPTDGSATANAGLREACTLAKEQGARLRVLHVVDESLAVSPEPYGGAYDLILEGLRKAGASILAEAESLARREGVTVETQLVEAMGLAAGEWVIRAAKERHSPVPILLIRQN